MFPVCVGVQQGGSFLDGVVVMEEICSGDDLIVLYLLLAIVFVL